MKKRIKSLCCFGIVFVVILVLLGNLLKVNNMSDSIRLRGFYMEPENSLDVVTIGASETYTAIAPGILWKEYGFTSYDYSMAGNPISLVKTQVKEVLKHQKPKVLVIEINGSVPENPAYQTMDSKFRTYLDNIPWSDNKRDAIREFVDKKDRYSYYIPFMKYHSNWKNIDECVANAYLNAKMHIYGGTKLKGFQTMSLSSTSPEWGCRDVIGDNTQSNLTAPAEYYLRELLDYLKKQHIQNVLFIRIPHRITDRNYGDYQRSNRAGEIVREYGYNFVNFEQDRTKMGLNNAKDFYNDHHMNINGQKKFTKYFGRYLASHYQLRDIPHSAELTARWNTAADETVEALQYTKYLMQKKQKRSINEGWRASRNLHLKR